MNLSKKFFLKLLICGVTSFFISKWLLIGFSYLTPVYFQAEVYNQNRQTLFFTTTDDGRFPFLFQVKKEAEIVPQQWQKISIAIPRHWASRLQLGFDNYDETILFKNITLNGQPFDLPNALHYQMRNIRFCNLSQDSGKISCRIGGENAYIAFSPQQIKTFIDQTSLRLWRVVFFILSLLITLILYNRYHHRVFLFLSKNYPDWLIFVLFAIALYSYSAMRWYAFSARVETIFFAEKWPEFFAMIQENAWALAVLFGTVILGFSLRNKWLKSFILIGSFILLFTEIIDSALLCLLNIRFIPGQVLEYGADTLHFMGPFIKSFLKSSCGAYSILLLLSWLITCIYIWKSHISQRLRQIYCIFAVFSLIWYLLPANLIPPEAIQLSDWPRLWLRDKIHIASGTQSPRTDSDLTYQCQDGLNGRQNIILIVMESISPYMSAYFSNGKIENWTPQLDKLARKYASFTNYRATGPDTTQSLFGILTGIPAIYFFGESHLYREPKFYHHTLAKTFNQAGYYTAFFTPAAWVYSKDYILQKAGFDKVSTDTDPFYDSKKRFVFHSVSDDVLYENVAQWIENYQNKTPYLVVLETATTHNPFVHPKTGEESLEKAVRYSDQALADFIEHLKEKKILDNTLVVIVSDHRIQYPPTTPQEIRVLGPDAQALVPLIIIGAIPTHNPNIQISHIDLAPSLEYLALPKACFHPYQYNIFSTEKTRPSCTLFLSILERHNLFVNCQEQRTKVMLFPQSSKIQPDQIPAKQEDSLLSFINWIRDNNRY